MEHAVLPMVQGENIVELTGQSLGDERKRNRRGIAGLRLAPGEVDALSEQTAGGARLETTDFKSQIAEGVAQRGGGVAHSATGLVLKTHMQQSAHERARRDDDRPCIHAQPEICFDAASAVVVGYDSDGISLFEVDPRRALKQRLCAELIRLLVALRPRRADARPFPRIEHPELNAGCVGIQPHHPAQCVDLTDHLALRLPADRGVAGHLPDGVEILGEHQGLTAEPGGCTRGFDPGVASTDDDDIVSFWVNEHGCSTWNCRDLEFPPSPAGAAP